MSGWGSTGSAEGGGGSLPNLKDPAKSVFSEVTMVASGAEETILTFVATAVPANHLLRVHFGGDNVAKFMLYFDDVLQDMSYTWWTKFNDTWEFTHPSGGGLPLIPDTVVKIKVIHERPDPGSFYCRLQYLEIAL